MTFVTEFESFVSETLLFHISLPHTTATPPPNAVLWLASPAVRLGAAVAVSGSIPAVWRPLLSQAAATQSVTNNRGRCRTVRKNNLRNILHVLQVKALCLYYASLPLMKLCQFDIIDVPLFAFELPAIQLP